MSILSAGKKLKFIFISSIPKDYIINIFSSDTQNCKFFEADSKPKGS